MRGLASNTGTSPQQMRETDGTSGPSKSSSELKLSSGDDIMQEVEDYTETSMVVINVWP